MKKNLIIISPYPKTSKYSHASSALASFNKNIADQLKIDTNIAILADNENKKDNVIKAWTKNDIFSYFKLLGIVASFGNIKDVLIQFEWGVFGQSILFVILFPFFLFSLKLLGKKSYVILHGVSFNFKSIFGHGLKTRLLNMGSYIFYSLVCVLGNKIIVTENYFKRILSKLPFTKEKIIYIPHGVDTLFKSKNKRNIKKISLGCFGFLHPYKGPKKLLDIFTTINYRKYFLTFFGGPSPSIEKNREYKNYLDKFNKKARIFKIKVTGFIKDKALSNSFNKTDLIIFPYSTFISSSGMLAMAFSFEKPFILSKPLAGYFESQDFVDSLKQTGLKKEDFLFDFNKESFEKRLNWAKNNLKKLSEFSRIMKEKRSWEKISKQYEKLI
jgi:glycosyltransferase involved in cell wall biosynthesis